MENKYSRGKIYKIECNITGNVYIGSTIEPTLARRLSGHTKQYNLYKQGNITKYITSIKILEGGDYNIYLIENYPCLSKDELHAREGHYIKEFKAGGNCVNIQIMGRTRKEYKNDNKERILINKKENTICDCGCEIRLDKLKRHLKSQKHLDLINEVKKYKPSEKISCECGAEFRYDSLKKHLKTKSHQENMKNK